jgi:hypothetical protein
MVGFDDGSETTRTVNDATVANITPQLTATLDTSAAGKLSESSGLSFMGITPSGPFDIPADRAAKMLIAPNPHGHPSSDVLRPWINGEEIADKWRGNWIVDFSSIESEAIASAYEQPFAYVAKVVGAARKSYKTGGKLFWKFERARPTMRAAFANHHRF